MLHTAEVPSCAEFRFNDKEGAFIEEWLGTEQSRKVLKDDPQMCMVQPRMIRTKLKFIMDTGCGHDFLAEERVTEQDIETFISDHTMSFQTEMLLYGLLAQDQKFRVIPDMISWFLSKRFEAE